jgi:hypothetical protein
MGQTMRHVLAFLILFGVPTLIVLAVVAVANQKPHVPEPSPNPPPIIQIDYCISKHRNIIERVACLQKSEK